MFTSVNRWFEALHLLDRTIKRFRVTKKEIPCRRKMRQALIDHAPLGLGVNVNQTLRQRNRLRA